jgi:predicted GIY-YIG superfamily endonuclease
VNFTKAALTVLALTVLEQTLANLVSPKPIDTIEARPIAIAKGSLRGVLGEINKFRPGGNSELYSDPRIAKLLDGAVGYLPDGVKFIGFAGGILVDPKYSGEVGVYRAIDEDTGDVIYVGITKNFERRAAEHFRESGYEIQEIEGLENLSRETARDVEEALIYVHGLGDDKGAGTLENKIHSISTRDPDYARRLNNGLALLRATGYPVDQE